MGTAGAADPAPGTAVPPSRSTGPRRPGGAGRNLVRGPDRYPVAAAAHHGVRSVRVDVLAAAGRLAGAGHLAAPARNAAGRTTRRRRAGPGPRGGGLLPPAGAQRGEQVGPSPVDRGRPGFNHHDVTQLLPLIDTIPPLRGRRGRPLRRPKKIYADRGYDHDKYRRQVRARGITPVIARRSTGHGSGLGTLRWVVERTLAWLHAFKRLRTRYERRADIHQARLSLACATICLRILHHSN